MSVAARETGTGGGLIEAALPDDGGGRWATRPAAEGAADCGAPGGRPLPAPDGRPGWVCEGGVWRRETIHSMLRRLPGWDYRQPWIYQITIVCADRAASPLGRLEVRRKGGAARSSSEPYREGWLAIEAARRSRISPERSELRSRLYAGCGRPTTPEEIEARVALSPLGAAIKELFWHFGDYTSEIKPLEIEVMPDHLHFIVQVTRAMARPLGNAIGGFKTGCEKLYRKLSLSGRDPAPNGPGAANGAGAANGPGLANGLGAANGPGLANGLGAANALGSGGGAEGRLFAEGFQDTILFRAGQLENMFRYLADNARRRAIKALWPDLFRVVSRLGVDLWLSAGEGRELSLDWQGVTSGGGPVPRAKARGWFMALGNRFLLGRPLAQIQVSRRDFGYRREPKTGGGLKICRDAAGEPIIDFSTPLYAEKKATLFAAAKHGAVLLSPCVSDGERQIAREALAAGLPLVALKNKGFSPLEKPSGRLFDACSDGRLLLLAPAAWPHVPGEKPMTRFDATAMNRLAQWIAGDGAAEINYHGMRPANIDALARAAVEMEKT